MLRLGDIRRSGRMSLGLAPPAAGAVAQAFESRLQVVLSLAAQPVLVLGVPAALRTAYALREHGIERMIFVTESPHSFTRAWRRQLNGLPSAAITSIERDLSETLDARCPALVIADDGMPRPDDLWRFVVIARAREVPTTWIRGTRVIATYYPEARDALGAQHGPAPGLPPPLSSAASIEHVLAHDHSWYDLRDPENRERAKRDLVASLAKESDGYLARWDRHISIALSQVLMRTSITPNAVTALSLLIGLVGAGLLAASGYAICLAGAMLLWSTCILDGCDGELARLKLLATRRGGQFDVFADNVVHVAIFLALPIHLRRTHPELPILATGIVLLSGVLLSMLCVWLLILRNPASARRPVDRFYERVASRDFIYVIVGLAAVGRLEWFLAAAAVGAHFFWMSLCWLSWRRR